MAKGNRSKLWLALFAGGTALAAIVGGRATNAGQGAWYRGLRKPQGQPPAWVFGPVWTALYATMSLSAYRVFDTPPSPERSRALRLWWTQLVFNGSWSPLFFGQHKARLALADLTALAGAIVSYARAAHKVDRPAAWMMAPYLAWVGYAGYLNAGIVRRNPRVA